MLTMKVYPLLKKTIIMLLVTVLTVGAFLFLICFNLFLFNAWDWRQPLIIGAWFVSSLILFILTPRNIYYEVNKKYVSVYKYRKQTIYYFNDVVYIDEEKSLKHKTVYFYTNKGHARYLTFDKQNLLYPTMLAHCKNRLSKEEFAQNYPNVKL